ncbi:MAG: glycosyltransferase [Sandaracinaceae bacterium]|nr:glycosyltransferase [Sandaracinaceae bacterium]
MSIFRPPEQILKGARVALILGPGNLNIDYAMALVRGPERALLELGAIVDTFNLSFFKEEILDFTRKSIPFLPQNSKVLQNMLKFLSSPPPGGWEFVLTHLYDHYLTEPIREALRKSTKRLISYPLNLLDQPHYFKLCFELFDEIWCAEEEALSSLRKQLQPTKILRYVPLESDPFIFRRLGEPEKPKVIFAGSNYGRRSLLLDRIEEVLPLTVTGVNHSPLYTLRMIARDIVRENHWPSIGAVKRRIRRSMRAIVPPPGDEAFAWLASEHGISIGINDTVDELTKKTVYKVRLREYDCAMCGLCHVARRLPELERHFVPGEEMLLYNDEDEAIEWMRKIAKGAVDWRRIGRNARARAESDHTWTRRFYDVFREEK